MGQLILIDILIIFTLSVPLILLLNKLKVPTILGFLLTGALIGPEGLGWIADSDQINILAEIGVALLLFSVGLEFSFGNLRVQWKSLTSGSLQITLTFMAGVGIGHLLGWNWIQGIYFGCILALSSTAVVMTTLSDQHSIDSLPGRYSTTILILQDLALIPMLVLLHFLGLQESAGHLAGNGVMLNIGQAVLFLLFVFVAIRYLGPWFFGHILRTGRREIFTISIIVIALGLAWMTHRLGLSFALGAFIGGTIIGSTPYKYQALSEISPFRYTFNSLFFVSIGMLVNFDFIRDNYALVLLLVCLIPLLKTVIVTTVLYFIGDSLRNAMTVGIHLGQIGEFSFLIAYLGKTAGVLELSFYELVVATAVIAMFMTPLMMRSAPAIANFMVGLPGVRFFAQRKRLQQLHEKAKELSDHVIICGYGPFARQLGNILRQHHVPYLILDFSPEIFDKQATDFENIVYEEGTSADSLHRGGIDRARILVITVPDLLNSLAIISAARAIAPDLPIFTRCKYENEVKLHYEAGADIVVAEELEGGTEMGGHILRNMGRSHKEVEAFLNKLRQRHYAESADAN